MLDAGSVSVSAHCLLCGNGVRSLALVKPRLRVFTDPHENHEHLWTVTSHGQPEAWTATDILDSDEQSG